MDKCRLTIGHWSQNNRTLKPHARLTIGRYNYEVPHFRNFETKLPVNISDLITTCLCETTQEITDITTTHERYSAGKNKRVHIVISVYHWGEW